jgi:hypothetical protein
MTSAEDYDFHATLAALEAARKQFPEDSEEARRIMFAFRLVIFINSERPMLREFFKWLDSASLPTAERPFNAVHTFTTQEEADAWLASGKAIDGERVIIAGQGYEVVDVPRIGLRFRWVPLPAQLAAWEQEEDEDAPES